MSIIQNTVKSIAAGETLSEDMMAAAVQDIMDGACDDVHIAAFLTALAMRGESVDEITGAARVMRDKAETIQAPGMAMDCCGTGGDQSGTLNISTAVSFVLAACGVPVAKHGNRASSSKSGAADVLEALGLNLDMTAERVSRAIEDIGIGFLMAPNHHQAMRHVMPVRKALGFRTLFNLLGPLANPAGTRYQLIGVFDKQWLRPFAEVLSRLGAKAAWIVHGSDGLDEITITGKTYVAELRDGDIREFEIAPADAGLSQSPIETIKGGDADYNARALIALLDGALNPYRDIVLFNAAAALIVNGKVQDLNEGIQLAAQAIDSGKAREKLDALIGFSNGQ